MLHYFTINIIFSLEKWVKQMLMLPIHAAVPALVALNRHVSVSQSSSVPCYMISPPIFTRKIPKILMLRIHAAVAVLFA